MARAFLQGDFPTGGFGIGGSKGHELPQLFHLIPLGRADEDAGPFNRLDHDIIQERPAPAVKGDETVEPLMDTNLHE
jgi:hypothetical protein